MRGDLKKIYEDAATLEKKQRRTFFLNPGMTEEEIQKMVQKLNTLDKQKFFSYNHVNSALMIDCS